MSLGLEDYGLVLTNFVIQNNIKTTKNNKINMMKRWINEDEYVI